MAMQGGLAAAIRNARETAHLTQAELAARADVSVQTVSRLERGLGVAEDSVRALAAALGIDSAVLPARPARYGMAAVGGTDPHWRDFVASVAESGEKVVASERADLTAYEAATIGVVPADASWLTGFENPLACMFMGMIVGISSLALGRYFVMATGVDIPGWLAWALAVTPPVAGLCWSALAIVTHGPIYAARSMQEAMATCLRYERYLLTDRALYVASGDPGGYMWRRAALDGATVSTKPIDGLAPGVVSHVVRNGAAEVVVSAAPAGGEVARALGAAMAARRDWAA